jgi:hypothetical protein
MLVGIIVGSFLLDHGLPTLRKMERTQLAAAKANDVGLEQKPPAPPKHTLLKPAPPVLTDRSDQIGGDQIIYDAVDVLTDRNLEQKMIPQIGQHQSSVGRLQIQ